MARGGYRPGAGRKPNPDKPKPPEKVPAQARDESADLRAFMSMLPDIQEISEQYARRNVRRTRNQSPFQVAKHPPAALPPKDRQMAFDEALIGANGVGFGTDSWLDAGAIGYAEEGLVFLGYPYLSELSQRPEYRVISETIADDATRKWIDFDVIGDEEEKRRREAADPVGEAERQADPDERQKRIKESGKLDKIKALKDDQERLEVQSRFYDLGRLDGFFGRSHLFLDFGVDEADAKELMMPIGSGRDALSRGKIEQGSLKALKVIEPVWTYPLGYNAVNPILPNWYDPQTWFVMGTEIHGSRLLTFIGHPVPDLLKPAYSFGGLSLTQMAKPYVDIWLTTRQSVADLIHSFSVMVLMTDMQTILAPGNAGALMARVALFNMLRDNQGLFAVNKNTEDFKNVSASLSGLHELQAQAQEHMASVSRIPLVKLTGIQPSGLNASSEGEINVYDDTIAAYQNRFYRPGLTRVINFEQLSLFGEVDPEIVFHFEPLRQMTQAEKGTKQKDDADRDQKYVDMGAIHPGEVRRRIIDDEELPYGGLGLDPDDVPDLADEEAQGLEPEGGRPQERGPSNGEREEPGAEDAADPFGATDEWREGDHPRAPDGKFGSGGGSSTTSTKSAKPASESLKPSDLKKIGGQKGSNEGGVFEDKGGNRFYIKRPATKDHVANELAAARLYRLAGVNTLDYQPVEGGNHVATAWQDLDKGNVHDFTAPERKAAARDFAVHAWLGNWDAAGTGGDNQGIVNGKPVTLDVGGSLRYRAQGGPKGAAWGPKVAEIDTMRDPKMSPDAARLFGKMTDADLRASIKRVTSIPDAAIREAAGDGALAETLIARKRDMARRFDLQAHDEAPFEESKHPRAPDGKFTSGAGGGSSAGPDVAALLKKKPIAGSNYRKALVKAIAASPNNSVQKKKLVENLIESWAKTAANAKQKGDLDTAKKIAKKIAGIGNEHGIPEVAGKHIVDIGKVNVEPSVPAKPAPKAEPKPEPASSTPLPAPTAAELAAAKKTATLQLKFIPGDKPTTAKFTEGAETIIKAFNDKYAGKTVTDPAALVQKVNDFKGVASGINSLAKIEQAYKATEALKQQEEAKKKAAALAAKAAEEAKAAAAKNAEVMKELGINQEQAEGFNALVAMLGKSTHDVSTMFQKYAKEAEQYGYPLTGFEAALVKSYSDGSYGAVNAALRSDKWTPAQHLYVAMVNRAVAKMPKYEGKLIRNTNLTAEQIAYYAEGHIIQEKALMSTSNKKPNGIFSGNVRFIVQSKGRRASSIQKLSHYGSEDEVLFSAKTYFKVAKVEKLSKALNTGATTVIHLEEWHDL